MPKARKAQISLVDTPYYHCMSRCVRRAYLCGRDIVSGISYEHRRQWVEDRIHFLSSIFAIDVCAYAVMSNHTHLILHINQKENEEWSNSEVLQRWHRLHKGTLLSRQYVDPTQRQYLSASQIETVEMSIQVWRQRLSSISWFMRSLNEYIARQANKEDDCSGRFWEGRFKSQALLDEAALAACMVYVDLNPIRANMARTPQGSNYTSIQYRINAARAGKTPKSLLPFSDDYNHSRATSLPFHLSDYLDLVDATARQLVTNQTNKNTRQTSIVNQLNIQSRHWAELTSKFEACFCQVAGNVASLAGYQLRHKLKRLPNKSIAIRLFG